MISGHDLVVPAADLPEVAPQALADAARRSGLDDSDAQLVRLFSTAVYHLPAADAVARIAQVTSPRDRGLHFGKDNHQRRFGASMRTHIIDAGFTLDPFAPIGPEVVEYGLIPGETLFIATRE